MRQSLRARVLPATQRRTLEDLTEDLEAVPLAAYAAWSTRMAQ